MKEANASLVSLASQKAGEGLEVLRHSVEDQRGFGACGGMLVGSESDCFTPSLSQFPERPSSLYRNAHFCIVKKKWKSNKFIVFVADCRPLTTQPFS